MRQKTLLRERKHKQRLKRLKILTFSSSTVYTPSTMPPVTSESSIELLALAYSISIYWDNDLLFYVADLGDFDCKIHAATWEQAAAAAKIVHQLLIAGYRQAGYSLPEV